MEFWNEIAIDRSFRILQELRKEINFVLIGGWAVYFLTEALKSKDIDIIVDFKDLTKLKTSIGIQKNEYLKKYEAEVEGVSIDIYVPYYSEFTIPPEEILKNTVRIENFRIPKPEILLILKQQAELQRRNSVKGQKDRVDIICLAKSGKVNWKHYKQLVKKFRVEEYERRLLEIIRSARIEFEYLGIKNLREVRKIKDEILGEISSQK
ncbi:MAG: hypothetical protein QXI42_04540 [Thermoproteota archaeon]|nr:hypothetical protein [Candidatus Brockarchaeota archaeon]